MANMANMINGVMKLSNADAFKDLRNATVADCVAWSAEGSKVTDDIWGQKLTPKAAVFDTEVILTTLGSPGCDVVLALQPFGRKINAEADPEDPAQWKVVGYEILARNRGGMNSFPFSWYAKLSKDQRIRWTVECALLSAMLNRHGIVAKFNVQDCDYEQVKQSLLQTFSVAMGDVHYELAEYAQNEKNLDGSIGLPAAKMRRLDEAVLDKYRNAALDDCGQGKDDAVRSYQATLDLVKRQAARQADGSLDATSFHTIKIDREPANIAFNQQVLNPKASPPTPETCLKARQDMENFVQEVWKVSPDMQFVVEATVTTKQKLDLVPSLVPSDPRVSFQGCHCHAACVLVNCEAATSRNWDSLVPEPGSNKRRRTVTSSSDSQAASAASSLDPDADALKLKSFADADTDVETDADADAWKCRRRGQQGSSTIIWCRKH